MQYINQRGITLIELLAVIVIIAIIASISLPTFNKVIHTQKDKVIISDIIILVSNAKIAFADDSCGEDKICDYNKANSNLDELGFNSSKFSEASVDFSNGISPEDIMIKVTLDTSVFKGRNKEDYIDLIGSPNKEFSEQELRDVLK